MSITLQSICMVAPGIGQVKTMKPYVITLAFPWREPAAQEGTDSQQTYSSYAVWEWVHVVIGTQKRENLTFLTIGWGTGKGFSENALPKLSIEGSIEDG